MSYPRANVASNEIESFRNENPPLSNRVEDITLTDDYTSYSGSSSNIFNLRTKSEVNSKTKCTKPSKTTIGSASIAKCTQVAFGTVFRGTVEIENFITDTNDMRNFTNVQYNDNNRSGLMDSRTKRPSKLKRVRSKRFLIFSIIAIVVVVLVSTIIAARRHSHFQVIADRRLSRFQDNLPSDGQGTTTMDDGNYEFVDRKQYGAVPSKTINQPLILPIRQVIISHTQTPICIDFSACTARVRQIQQFHMTTRGWDDIGLHFLVGGDGRAYEGCGYTYANGSHIYPNNNVSICIAFIGDFASYEASQKQLRAAQRIIDDGIKNKKIHPNYVLYGQRQLANFDSPGVMLYYQIMSWPHWSKEVIPLS